MESAIASAERGISEGAGFPFGAAMIRNKYYNRAQKVVEAPEAITGDDVWELLLSTPNTVHIGPDPTAHAEMMAIRLAASKLGRNDLSDCILFATGEPCPMCTGACLSSRISVVYVGVPRETTVLLGNFPDKLREEVGKHPNERTMLKYYWMAGDAETIEKTEQQKQVETKIIRLYETWKEKAK